MFVKKIIRKRLAYVRKKSYLCREFNRGIFHTTSFKCMENKNQYTMTIVLIPTKSVSDYHRFDDVETKCELLALLEIENVLLSRVKFYDVDFCGDVFKQLFEPDFIMKGYFACVV